MKDESTCMLAIFGGMGMARPCPTSLAITNDGIRRVGDSDDAEKPRELELYNLTEFFLLGYRSTMRRILMTKTSAGWGASGELNNVSRPEIVVHRTCNLSHEIPD